MYIVDINYVKHVIHIYRIERKIVNLIIFTTLKRSPWSSFARTYQKHGALQLHCLWMHFQLYAKVTVSRSYGFNPQVVLLERWRQRRALKGFNCTNIFDNRFNEILALLIALLIVFCLIFKNCLENYLLAFLFQKQLRKIFHIKLLKGFSKEVSG